MCMYECGYIYIYIYIYVCVCVCVLKEAEKFSVQSRNEFVFFSLCWLCFIFSFKEVLDNF